MAKTSEPWFGHDSIFPYVHVMIFKEVLERTASADRRKVGEMLRRPPPAETQSVPLVNAMSVGEAP